MSNYSDSAFHEASANSSWYKVLQLIPEKAEVLDIGCSSGTFGAELIERKQCTVDGIELEPEDAKLASKKLREVHILNIEHDSIDALSHRYDVIYFGDVIEHLVHPAAALNKVKKLLKPQGKVVFSIPNMAHATVRLQLLKGEFEYTETGLLDKTHLHFYNLKEVENVFKEAGYTIKRLDFIEKDYPNELIDAYLEKIGLQANKKFYDLMHRADAAAFQFVGEAAATSSAKAIKRKQFGPIDFFESFFNNTVGPLRERIAQLEEQVASQQQEINAQQERWDDHIAHPFKSAARVIKKRK